MQNSTQLFDVAIYLRLSKDDGDISTYKKSESNSIHNQRELLMAFLCKHPEMKLCAEYKDDGWSGTNFERPDFQRMMEDVKRGRINCILVKDLSRFGRDYIECGKYIEKIFPQLGIRFIAVNDGLDTLSSGNIDNIVVPFKNLLNDSYCRDISIKVRSSQAAKRRKGDFISNFTVYGYDKDPNNKNHLIIDEYAAGVVKDIFKWTIDGMSPGRIADRLDERGILSPMEYKKSQGSKFRSEFKTSKRAKWSYVAIRRILENEVYTGVMIQGKRTTPNYKTKKMVYKPKNEWDRVESTHDAIILRAQFDLVQQILQEDTRVGKEEVVHPYCGRIFCGDCGEPMVRKISNAGGKQYVYYVCKANKMDRHVCSSHSIREDVLNNTMLAIIQRQIEVALDMDRALAQIEALTWEKAEMRKIDANIVIQEEDIQRNNELRLGIYEDLKKGILSREEFVILKEEFAKRITSSREAIERLNSSKSEIMHGLSKHQSWLSQFREYENITEITRRLIIHLVERINLYEGPEIEVIFRHRDQFENVMAFLKDQKKADKSELFCLEVL